MAQPTNEPVRTQLGQYAHNYLISYAEERLEGDPDADFTPEQVAWIKQNETALARHLEQAVEGYMMDADIIPGEDDDT